MARRGNGEGTITKRADGRYAAAMSLPAGKRKWFYGKTRAQVASKLRQALQHQAEGLPVAGEEIRVGAFLEQWLDDVAKAKLRPRVFASYRQVVRQHPQRFHDLRHSAASFMLAQGVPLRVARCWATRPLL